MKFEEIHAQMAPFLRELKASTRYCMEAIGNLGIQSGVYVFCEHDKAMYVGRVSHLGKQDIKTRARQHFGGNVKKAPLAAVMLRKDLNLKTGPGARFTIAQYAEKYKLEFEERQQRVRKMEVQAIEITDCTTRAIFEIYAALTLGAQYNQFCES